MRSPIFRSRVAVLVACAAVAVLLVGGGDGDQQESAPALVPPPELAVDDKGPMILDGCRSGNEYTEAWTCVYGDPSAEQTVVLWGDSHAMHFTPPFIRLAEQRGWRLVTMFRGYCLAADVAYEPECDTWRANAIARIEDEQPDLIVTSTDIGDGYALRENGQRLTRPASEPILHDGYVRTLLRLKEATGGQPGSVVVLRDIPRFDFRPPDCLEENPDDPSSCDIRGFRKNAPGFDLTAASQVDGVRLVDPSEVVCPGGICPASRDGMVTYRDATHLSATYATSLAEWLGERIDIP